jgi:hypothetical protein
MGESVTRVAATEQRSIFRNAVAAAVIALKTPVAGSCSSSTERLRQQQA